ncbi:heavy metal translocatin [Panus rudis PR-1116 ss-1]|nr:heavy metal translocatin [Panus rudis PR-1116 ss-1]
MTCASCVNTVTSALSDVHGVSDVTVNLLGNAASANIQDPELVNKLVEAVEDVGYEGEVISVEPLRRQVPASRNVASGKTREGPFRAILSVGGMTCASCSNTITRLCSEIAGVSDVAVDLIGKSASAIIEKKDLTDKLVETIEHAGYDAEVIEVSSLGNERSDTETEHIGPRTVTLKVDGMTCPHCPPNVMHALEPILDRITIDKPITNHTDPILRVTYTPDPPHFTIRTIIDAIASSDSVSSQKFSASICHPPSLEARARHMQAKEQRSLLLRLAFSVVVAIPTFIIAVVYMSLVPSSNHVRMWFMRPMWAGNASRIQWALLFLATPVMFYSAGIFHRRSLKELWALWTRGNTPIWKRFVRFGSMNLLVSSGVSVAYFSSIALLALAAVEPASDSEGDSTTYFDSVVFLTMFLLAGRFLEAYSKSRTADAITALGKLRPSSALLLIPYSAGRTRPSDSPNAGTVNLSTSTSSPDEVDQEKSSEEAGNAKQSEIRIEAVSVDLLEVGDVVRVQHGASPPADGTVISGDAGAFDESSLTGESRLVPKAIGDKVYVGTINKGSPVDVRVDAIGGETMLDHVVKVVREGQSRRAPIERVADVLTGYFVPVVTLLAIITWIVWLALGETGALPPDYLDIDVGGWPVWSLEFAIAVFVVACPCGIGLAAPTALLVGSGLAAKFGILVRGGGEAFQEAAQLDLVVFDKTGTLTEGGEPRVTDAEFITGSDDVNPPTSAALTRGVLLGIAIELESASSHPLASAIRQYCEENGVVPQIGTSFEETPGRGVKAYFELLRCVAVIGNEAWIEEHGADINGRISSTLNAWKTEGKSVILLAVREHADNSEDLRQGYTVRALFAVSDPLRPEASSVVSRLNAQGINTWMISGDNEITARAVAKMVGIAETNVIAGVLPHEKAEKIRWLQMVGMKRAITGWRRLLGFRRLNGRCIVAMVGDGINDAPALTAADVGIAIGSGSDVALSSASFILVSSDLRSLLTLADLSRRVFNRVKFNFLWATVYNIIALPIAAGVVYPAGHARLSPVWASLAMALSSVSVVTSSLLLRLYKEPASPRA